MPVFLESQHRRSKQQFGVTNDTADPDGTRQPSERKKERKKGTGSLKIGRDFSPPSQTKWYAHQNGVLIHR
jgi:hypothetical protein